MSVAASRREFARASSEGIIAAFLFLRLSGDESSEFGLLVLELERPSSPYLSKTGSFIRLSGDTDMIETKRGMKTSLVSTE